MPEKPPQSKAKKNSLHSDDQSIWDVVTRDVRPLKKANVIKSPSGLSVASPSQSRPKTDGTISLEILDPQGRRHTSAHKSAFQLDSNLQKKFENGDLLIEGQIDLHGMNLGMAHQRFEEFLTRNIKRGSRFLLVVTGKGTAGKEGERGIIRKNLPHWCDTQAFFPHILKIKPAKPKHGGAGAFYILLRRKK